MFTLAQRLLERLWQRSRPFKRPAKQKNLPLGTYTLKEKAASEGYILNNDTWTVEIQYAGQNVEITNVDQKIENKRTKGFSCLNQNKTVLQEAHRKGYDFAGAEFDLFRKSDNKTSVTTKQMLRDS